MSSQAQMDACGVLCHLEVHPFIPAINREIVDASSTGVTTMDKADLPFLLFVRMLPKVRVPVYSYQCHSLLPYSCFGQGPVDSDGLM